VGDGGQDSVDDYIPETYPCLYVHTLVNELANHSQVNITGTLLSDGLFRQLILTPPGANFKDPTTRDQVFLGSANDITGSELIPTNGILIKPEMIAPIMKAIDFIKWLSVTFGCIVSFDEAKNTISLDILARFNKADAEDWTAYYKSHTEEYKDIKRNNNIFYKDSDDEDISDYNEVNSTKFGCINIQSDRDDISERTLYTAPFPAVLDKVGTSNLKLATPYIPFVTLSDENGYRYTSVTDGGAGAGTDPDNRRLQFNGTGFPFNGLNTQNNVVRIVDDSGLYNGFHVGDPIATSSSTIYKTKGRFLGNSTGTIYIQSAQKNNNQFVLVAVPDIIPSDISMAGDFFQGATLTTIATAYFSKPYTPYSTLNAFNKGLSFDEINITGYNDISLSEAYLRPIFGALVSPTIRSKMLIPVDVFARFNGSKLIYLNTGTLNGYFVVQKIEHYRDSMAEVLVYISNFE
jgi:hypothetical protein